MIEQITTERLHEYLAFSKDEEDEEMVAILSELKDRRGQSSYNRSQRLDFMLRMIKDTAPEIAKELREIYREQENVIYYARRDIEYWKRQAEAVEA